MSHKRPKLKEDVILPAVWVHLGNSNLRTLDQLEQVCAGSSCTWARVLHVVEQGSQVMVHTSSVVEHMSHGKTR